MTRPAGPGSARVDPPATLVYAPRESPLMTDWPGQRRAAAERVLPITPGAPVSGLVRRLVGVPRGARLLGLAGPGAGLCLRVRGVRFRLSGDFAWRPLPH